MLPAVPICFDCGGGAVFMSAHPERVMFAASVSGLSKGGAAFPVAHLGAAATVRVTPPFSEDGVVTSCNRAPPSGTVLSAVPSLVDGDGGAQRSSTHTVRSVGLAQVVLHFAGFAAWDAACVFGKGSLDGAVLAADASCLCVACAT